MHSIQAKDSGLRRCLSKSRKSEDFDGSETVVRESSSSPWARFPTLSSESSMSRKSTSAIIDDGFQTVKSSRQISHSVISHSKSRDANSSRRGSSSIAISQSPAPGKRSLSKSARAVNGSPYRSSISAGDSQGFSQIEHKSFEQENLFQTAQFLDNITGNYSPQDGFQYDSGNYDLLVYMVLYKTDKCNRRPCSRNCEKYHSVKERRRSPLDYEYSEQPCPSVKTPDGKQWIDPTKCPIGDRCGYAHTLLEQMYHPNIYKSGTCNKFSIDPKENQCSWGPLCTHAHGSKDREKQAWAFGVIQDLYSVGGLRGILNGSKISETISPMQDGSMKSKRGTITLNVQAPEFGSLRDPYSQPVSEDNDSTLSKSVDSALTADSDLVASSPLELMDSEKHKMITQIPVKSGSSPVSNFASTFAQSTSFGNSSQSLFSNRGFSFSKQTPSGSIPIGRPVTGASLTVQQSASSNTEQTLTPQRYSLSNLISTSQIGVERDSISSIWSGPHRGSLNGLNAAGGNLTESSWENNSKDPNLLATEVQTLKSECNALIAKVQGLDFELVEAKSLCSDLRDKITCPSCRLNDRKCVIFNCGHYMCQDCCQISVRDRLCKICGRETLEFIEVKYD